MVMCDMHCSSLEHTILTIHMSFCTNLLPHAFIMWLVFEVSMQQLAISGACERHEARSIICSFKFVDE